nr:transposase [Spirulina subsalsa]
MMKYNPETHHRRSIRLPCYDYSQPGAYFITLCTHQKQCWFGQIDDGKMYINQLGKIVQNEWLKSAQMRPNLSLDEWIVMPNHLHGIVWLSELEKKRTNNSSYGNLGKADYADLSPESQKKAFRKKANSLGSFIGGFKASVTKQINQFRENTSIPIWQRNYYESIIQDETALNSIREYIQNNPQRWEEDPDHPQCEANFSELLLDLVF